MAFFQPPTGGKVGAAGTSSKFRGEEELLHP